MKDEKYLAQQEKLKICESCDDVRIIEVPFISKSLLQCKICNCFMNAKVKLAAPACPVGKF